MQRPPIACRRAAHSLTRPPQNHIWISEEFLTRTVQNFFRSGCAHQKRHGSNVPGPLEARRRAAKRKMTLQARLPQGDALPPLFDFTALLRRRPNPESSWRYEPPSTVKAPPPPRPAASSNISCDQSSPSSARNVSDSTPKAEPTKEHISKVSAIKYTRAGPKSDTQVDTSRERELRTSSRNDGTTLDMELMAFEKSLPASKDLDTRLDQFETWIKLASRLKDRQRFCKERYPDGKEEILARNSRGMAVILERLSQPNIPSPHLGTSTNPETSDQDAKTLHGTAVYRSKWKRLLQAHVNSMAPQDFQNLKLLAVFHIHLDPTNTHSSSINTDHVLEHVFRFAESKSLDRTLVGQVYGLLSPSIVAKARARRQFKRILDMAADGHALPLHIRCESVETLMKQRTEIIHQIAHQYSIDYTRSYLQNWRSIYYLYRYLKYYKLPIGPLFTKAVVRVCLTQPMTQNRFVSARRLTWVCELVARVQGEAVAKNIEYVFWTWRGNLIQQAKKTSDDSGGSGPARISTMKRLGIH